jgi:hypothetical protein
MVVLDRLVAKVPHLGVIALSGSCKNTTKTAVFGAKSEKSPGLTALKWSKSRGAWRNPHSWYGKQHDRHLNRDELITTRQGVTLWST